MKTGLIFNKCQGNIDELLEGLPTEIQNEVLSSINDIPYISKLVSTSRHTLDDVPRNAEGEVIVDLSNPHILDDMDYFRQPAIRYKETGKYTDAIRSKHKKSAWAQFWKEEAAKCLTRVVNPNTKDWIPGIYYFYLNYSPILRVKKDDKGEVVDRIFDFPDVYDSDYWYYHYLHQARTYEDRFFKGLHAAVIKARGMGYSFKAGSMLAIKFMLGDSKDAQTKIRALALASEKEYLTKDGVLNKFLDIATHCMENTGWGRNWITNSINDMRWKSGYQTKDGFEKGRRNEVIGISMRDNADKARGKRASLILYEEFGKFPNFIHSWGVNRPSVEADRVAYGQQICFGTGGTENQDFSGAEEMIYHPEGYRVYGIPNMFDKGNNENNKSVFFCSQLYNVHNCYDENGNSDIVAALVDAMYNRWKTKHNTSDPMAVTRYIAERPITISEAIMKTEGTLFPVADLKEYRNEIKSKGNKFYDLHYVGDLVTTGRGSIEWKLNSAQKPIRKYPITRHENALGSLEIFEMPKKGRDGKVFSNRYILGCLTPNEQVMTNEGLKNIQDVTLQNKLINEEGELVAIKNIQQYSVINEDTYRIQVANTLRTTNFTKEHPILVSRRKTRYINYKKASRLGISQRYYEFNFKYVTANKVTTDDWIKVPNTYKKVIIPDYDSLWDNNEVRIDRQIENPLTKEDLWWFVGLWLGDGWCNCNEYSISISLNKSEFIYKDRLVKIINNIFKRKVTEEIESGYCNLSFCNKQLNKFLTQEFGAKADGKFIPEWVKYLPHNYKYKLIQGYLDSDGCITKNKQYYSTEFVSINLKLLESFQDILYSIGVIGGLSKLRDEGTTYFKDKKYNTKEAYHLRVSHQDTLILVGLLNDRIDHKISRIDFNNLPVVRRNPKNNCHYDSTQDYIYFKVLNVEKDVFTGNVYNFECDTHTFMCHHITTHNCDPVDDDHSTTNSLTSVFGFDLLTDRIVFEYTGRPKFANDFYELCRRLCVFYNGVLNYEAHPYSEIIKLPSGETKLWGDVQIGDELFAPKGRTVKVVDIPVDEYMPIYKMTLGDGREIMCSDNHIWSVHRLNLHPHKLENYTTKELLEIGTQNKFKQNNFFIPNAGPVEYPYKKLPLDPYTMGLLIAEGCFRGSHCSKNQIQISSSFKDMEFYKTQIPYEIKYSGTKGFNWNIVIKDCKRLFKDLGLLNSRSESKFIPPDYLYNSYDNRLELLKGMMDGDGSAGRGGSSVYVTSSPLLARDFVSLCRSLGFNCRSKKNKTTGLDSYKIVVYTDKKIFKLPRKLNKQHVYDSTARGSKALAYKNKIAIKSIEFSHYEQGKCVTVDSDDGLYLIGDYVVTHNCDKKGLFTYFDQKNSLYLLADTPQILRDMDYVKGATYGNKAKGVNSGKRINEWGRRLQRDWMLTPAYSQDYDKDGNQIGEKLNLHTIRSTAYLDEAIMWNADGNFDRISAMGMLMIYREDRKKYLYNETSDKSDGIENDPYFTENFNSILPDGYVQNSYDSDDADFVV